MSEIKLIESGFSREEIQALLNGAKPGDRFVFEPGIYRMSLVIDGKGTANAPIILEAEQSGTVTIRPQVFAGEVRGGSLAVDKGAIQGGGTAAVDRRPAPQLAISGRGI